MRWTGRDLREQLGVPNVADETTATETEDDTCRPVLHLSDGRVASTNPDWPHKPGAERWLIEEEPETEPEQPDEWCWVACPHQPSHLRMIV